MLHAVMHVACDKIILCKSALRNSMAQGAVGSLLCHSLINEAPPRPRGNSGTCQDDPNKTTTKFIPPPPSPPPKKRPNNSKGISAPKILEHKQSSW